MKEGWEIRKLGEVATITAGQSPEGKYYNNQGIGMPFYQGKKEFGEKYIGKPSSWTTFVTKIAKPLDILMSVRAPVGDVNFNVGKCCIGRGLASICPGTKLDKYFMFYYLVSINDKITGKEGAVFPSISKKDIENIPIPIPPLSEQQRIVSKLDSVFEKIDALKANAENNLKNAKDLFQKVLKKELEPKEGWSEKRMIEIADLCLGKMLDKQKNKGIKQPYLRNVNVRWGSFNCSDILEIPFEKDEETRYSIIKNDIVMCEGGEPGRCAIWTSEKSIKFQKALHRIRCKKETNPQFLYYTFLMYYNSGKLKKHYSGTTILHLTGEKLKEIFISLPSLSEQQRIVSILDSLSDKCKQLEENYSKMVAECDALKQSILREVMSEK